MNSRPIVWSDLRFLVVEDDADMRNNIVRLLEHHGSTRVDQASNGIEALPFLKDKMVCPDCVIADIKMEPMSGIELAHAIRSDPAIVRHDLPIVMVTGYADSSNLEIAIKLDVDAFIAKPASRATLTGRIEWALQGEKSVKRREHYAAIKLPREGAQAGEPRVIKMPPRVRKVAQIVMKEPGEKKTRSRPYRLSVNKTLEEIPPGTLLAADVTTPKGALLMSAGEKLTESVLRKLRTAAQAYPELESIEVKTEQ